MDTATFLQVVRLLFIISGSAITAKTGLTFDDVQSAVGPVATAVGTVWSLIAGVRARAAAK